MSARSLTTLSDDDLVTRFRSGDDTPFHEIDRRYRRALTTFARRMLSAAGHDPEDVVQDAFIRAYRGLRATDRPMALRPWLYMIVRKPERQRMALVMREFDGCSHVETTRRLPTTVPATKSLIVRARSNLGAAMHAA